MLRACSSDAICPKELPVPHARGNFFWFFSTNLLYSISKGFHEIIDLPALVVRLVFRCPISLFLLLLLLIALWGRAIPTLTHGTNLKALLCIFLCCCRTFAEELVDPWMLCLAGEALETHASTVPVFVDQPSQVVGAFLFPFPAVWAGSPIHIFDLVVFFVVARKLSPHLKIPFFDLCSFLSIRKKLFACQQDPFLSLSFLLVVYRYLPVKSIKYPSVQHQLLCVNLLTVCIYWV